MNSPPENSLRPRKWGSQIYGGTPWKHTDVIIMTWTITPLRSRSAAFYVNYTWKSGDASLCVNHHQWRIGDPPPGRECIFSCVNGANYTSSWDVKPHPPVTWSKVIKSEETEINVYTQPSVMSLCTRVQSLHQHLGRSSAESCCCCCIWDVKGLLGNIKMIQDKKLSVLLPPSSGTAAGLKSSGGESFMNYLFPSC